MSERRLLVIGSQCEALNRLDFLPAVAESLHALLADPRRGGCVSVPLDGRPAGLMIDPTVAEARDAMERAILDAARDRANLILAYIGHGEFPHLKERSGKFFLMPVDATEPTPRRAIDLVQLVDDCLGESTAEFGLLVLLDACQAGAGAWYAMERWARSMQGNFRFALLTPTDDCSTNDARLARAVIEVLERGAPEVAGGRIHARDIPELFKPWPRPPQCVEFNAGSAGLDLGRNLAHDLGDAFWRDSPGRDEILEHTWYFQPTPQLDALVGASRAHPLVVLTGDAGAGKTSLAAALARPEVAGGHVPDGFAHAIAVLGGELNGERPIAVQLERQLRRSVPGFAGAVAEFERSVTLPERNRLDNLSRMVLRPLAYLEGTPEVRIVLDGFDQLPDGTREAVGGLLGSCPGHVHLVITARTHTMGCPPGHTLHHGPTPRQSLDHYLEARRLPDRARPAILDRAGDHWLLGRLLADAVLADPAIDLARLPDTVNDAYAKLLDQAGAGSADAWDRTFRPVLAPLAVAGPGPILPLPLLARASQELGGQADESGVRAVLARLRGLVLRRDAGAPGEHVGLFHPTLAEYLLGPSAARAGYALDGGAAHRALARAIEALAPMGRHDRDDPLHRYAFFREAEHLWALGDPERTFACLSRREANDPRANLERWRPWLPRFRGRFAEDHPTPLDLRGWIATLTGEAGDARGALELFRALLPDQERALGRDHPGTLTTRSNLAHWTGETGDARGALRLFAELLPDRERVLGRDHPDTLNTLGFVGF